MSWLRLFDQEKQRKQETWWHPRLRKPSVLSWDPIERPYAEVLAKYRGQLAREAANDEDGAEVDEEDQVEQYQQGSLGQDATFRDQIVETRPSAEQRGNTETVEGPVRSEQVPAGEALEQEGDEATALLDQGRDEAGVVPDPGCRHEDASITTLDDMQDVDVVTMWTRPDDDEHSPCAEAREIQAFSSKFRLRALTSEPDSPQRPVALVVDRDSEGKYIDTPENHGPLGSGRLYRALHKRRFHQSQTSPMTGVVSRTAKLARRLWLNFVSLLCCVLAASQTEIVTQEDCSPKETLRHVRDAWQRRVYVTDLDYQSIGAIACTAPRYQRRALCTMIYRHLQYSPWMNIDVPSEGLQRLELTFHLPYKAWRPSLAPNADSRFFEDGSRLRKHEDISFLGSGSSSRDYIYEAQISFLIIATSYEEWVSYYFEDTHYAPHPNNERQVEVYLQTNAGPHIDASTRGWPEFDDDAIRDVREYFLVVFRRSLDHVRDEWMQVVDFVCKGIRNHERCGDDDCPSNLKHLASKEAADLSVFRWELKAKMLSNKLSRDLDCSVNTLERYMRTHKDKLTTELCRHELHRIGQFIEEFVALRNRLDEGARVCDDLIKDMDLRLTRDLTKAGEETGRDNKFFAFIMTVYVSPVAVAAALFSMDKVLPGKALNLGTFVAVTAAFGLLGRICHDPSWCKEKSHPAIRRLMQTKAVEYLRSGHLALSMAPDCFLSRFGYRPIIRKVPGALRYLREKVQQPQRGSDCLLSRHHGQLVLHILSKPQHIVRVLWNRARDFLEMGTRGVRLDTQAYRRLIEWLFHFRAWRGGRRRPDELSIAMVDRGFREV